MFNYRVAIDLKEGEIEQNVYKGDVSGDEVGNVAGGSRMKLVTYGQEKQDDRVSGTVESSLGNP